MRDAPIHWLEPAPAPGRLPSRLSSPFDDVAPHPLAQEAARPLVERLTAGVIAPGVSTRELVRPEGGKMFGVLVVRAPEGRVGALWAFSGQVAGQWELEGYAPPLFDEAARAQVEPVAEARVKALTAQLEALAASDELEAARAAVGALTLRHEAQKRAQKERLAARKQARHGARTQLLSGHRDVEDGERTNPEPVSLSEVEGPRSSGAPGPSTSLGLNGGSLDADRRLHAALRALDEESRADDLERRKAEAARRAEREEASRALGRLERRLGAIERLRRFLSRRAMRHIHDTYVLTNPRGRTATLRELFTQGEPPWGAGDCAAPKLFAAALRQGLEPLALAELWWGPPPPAGGRVEGAFFPACREKCGPLLPFLLEGLEVAPRRTVRPREVSPDELVVLHEDARVAVVLKPEGLLSVPAKDEAVTDSVLARVRARWPRAQGPLVVHRLDLDTSGLLVVALDEDAHRRLQAQFLGRTIHKRYVALLDGEVRGERGLVSLPLRVDLDQRPRQLVDFVHGKAAVTEWEVISRAAGRTRVRLVPKTGRTHQLRVHAAHAEGLGAPIVGDRLYGHAAERLYLHAEALAFDHPDGGRLSFEAQAPF